MRSDKPEVRHSTLDSYHFIRANNNGFLIFGCIYYIKNKLGVIIPLTNLEANQFKPFQPIRCILSR